MGTIIETSNKTSSRSISNAEWITTTSGIILEEGDQLVIKNCFLDTGFVNGNYIEVPENITIDMEYITYCYNTNGYGGQETEGDIDNTQAEDAMRVGIAFKYTGPAGSPTLEPAPFVSHYRFLLKAGTYSPHLLAEELTRQFSLVKNRDLDELDVIGPDEFLKATDTTDDDFKYMFVSFDEETGALNLAKKWYYKQYTQFGAQNVSLVFDDISQTFRFDYLHTPLYSGKDKNVISTWVKYLQATDILFEAHSGIMIKKLYPVDFWASLGFDASKIEVGINEQTNLIFPETKINTLITKFRNVSTGGLFTNSNLYLSSEHYIGGGGDAADTYAAAPNTRPIRATNNFDPLAASYFLVEIVSKFMTDYRDNDNIRRNIQAIVSRQYTGDNFVIATEDASIGYIHSGEPTVLNDLHVRILRPDKTPAKNVLGANSVLFLQLFKALKEGKN